MSANPYASPQSVVADPSLEGAGEKQPWKQLYFSAEGRIPRKAYWINGALFFTLVWIALYVIEFILGAIWRGLAIGYLIVAIPVWLVLVYASIIMQIKRWHDRDKSGWWILISIVPFIGALWVFIEAGCLRGTDGPNRFGGDATGLY